MNLFPGKKSYNAMVAALMEALHAYILGDHELVKLKMNEATIHYQKWTELV